MKRILFKIAFVFTLTLLLNPSCKKKSLIKIGATYQGGIIFYIDDTKEHGYICSSSNQVDLIYWYSSSNNDASNANGTSVGSGSSNTTTIVSKYGNGNYAAKLCADLVLNEYSDWFLPSKDELNLIYSNLYSKGLGNFKDGLYWSSSEFNDNNGLHEPWYQFFTNVSNAGNQSHNSGYSTWAGVIAVRAF